jgi:hypothetical protein
MGGSYQLLSIYCQNDLNGIRIHLDSAYGSYHLDLLRDSFLFILCIYILLLVYSRVQVVFRLSVVKAVIIECSKCGGKGHTTETCLGVL